MKNYDEEIDFIINHYSEADALKKLEELDRDFKKHFRAIQEAYQRAKYYGSQINSALRILRSKFE